MADYRDDTYLSCETLKLSIRSKSCVTLIQGVAVNASIQLVAAQRYASFPPGYEQNIWPSTRQTAAPQPWPASTSSMQQTLHTDGPLTVGFTLTRCETGS